MKIRARVLLASAAAAAATAGAAAPAIAATQAPSAKSDSTVVIQSKITKHFRCASKHAKPYISVSWVYPQSNISTTVYFNNHCGGTRHIQTWRQDGSGWKGKGKCLTVHGHTHGKKKITDPGFDIYKVTIAKKC